MITGRTALFCILADPIEHVRTPQMFNDHLRRIGADAVRRSRARRAQRPGGRRRRVARGPEPARDHRHASAQDRHRRAVRRRWTSRRAASARSMSSGANPIGRLRRCRTSTGWASSALSRLPSAAIAGRAVYLAGAGGAARAIAFELARAGVSRLALYNRSAAKADALPRRQSRNPSRNSRALARRRFPMTATSPSTRPRSGSELPIRCLSRSTRFRRAPSSPR